MKREKERKGFSVVKEKKTYPSYSDNLLYWLDSLLDDSCKGYLNDYTSWCICQGCRDL